MSDLNKLVKATIKAWGEEAPVHFGLKKGTLDGYLKRGKYPLKLIEQILNDQKEPGPRVETVYPQTEPPPAPEPAPPPPPQGNVPQPYPGATEKRVEDIVRYLQGTVDFYIRQFSSRIALMEKAIVSLSNAQLRATGMPSLTNPGAHVPVDQTFTTNPHGHALDTGIAPTKEMVDAQANMTILEGVPQPGGQLARPAEFIPNLPSYGFGWNQARPRK